MFAVFGYVESGVSRDVLLREDLLDLSDGVLIGDNAGAKLAVSRDGGLHIRRVR